MLSDKSFLTEPIDATRHDDVDVIPFRDKSGSPEDDGIREWTAIRRLGSGKTTLASSDYKNPGAQRVSFDSSAPVWSAVSPGSAKWQATPSL